MLLCIMQNEWKHPDVMKKLFPKIDNSYKKRVKWENWSVLDESVARDMSVSNEFLQRKHIWKVQTLPKSKTFGVVVCKFCSR